MAGTQRMHSAAGSRLEQVSVSLAGGWVGGWRPLLGRTPGPPTTLQEEAFREAMHDWVERTDWFCYVQGKAR